MIELKFQADTYDEIKLRIQEFAANHLNMKLALKEFKQKTEERLKSGRPKMSKAQHLGLTDCSEKEVHEIIDQVYMKMGEKEVFKVFKRFGIQKIHELKPLHYDRFIKYCLDRLQQKS